MIGEKVCYAAGFIAEAFTVWLYLDYLFPRKKSTWAIAINFALGYLFLIMISHFNNTTLNATFCCIINYTIIMLSFQCSLKVALLHTAFLCFIMTGSEIIVALMSGIFGFEFSSYTHNFYALVTLTILSRLLYLAFSIIGSRFFAPDKQLNGEPHFMVLFCSLPILSAVIAIFTVYFGMTSGVTKENGIMMLITISTLFVVNLFFLVLYNYMAKANEEYLTLRLSLQKEKADVAYYEALREQFENQRILVHDIKKHMGAIDVLAKQGRAAEIEAYLSELNTSLAPSKQARLCTDSMLNLLLLRFCDECKDANVDFHCDVRENISVFMDAASITTLYGNLLSNALEASMQSQCKQIDLSVTWNAMQSAIVISVVNTCDIFPIPDGEGSFFTKKPDKRLHGIGLRSIDRIVKKYHGIATMYYNQESKQFHHVIQFPKEISD